MLVTYQRTSVIEDQLKEGNSLGLDCAATEDVKDLSNFASAKKRLFAELKLKLPRAICYHVF